MNRLENVSKQVSTPGFTWVLKQADTFDFENVGNLKNKTIVITGGSRGIGLAIALKAAKDGANIAILAKTASAHPHLPGKKHQY